MLLTTKCIEIFIIAGVEFFLIGLSALFNSSSKLRICGKGYRSDGRECALLLDSVPTLLGKKGREGWREGGRERGRIKKHV